MDHQVFPVVSHPRPAFSLGLPGGRRLELGHRTLLMGILNVTPDSFADGGIHLDTRRAIETGERLEADGADIIDIGGESTRPGAQPLEADAEVSRILPVLEGLAATVSVPLSVDTYKADVARRAIDCGAALVNDISALGYDPDLAGVVATSGVPVVLMHNRGRSREMYREARYARVAAEVVEELEAAMERATAAGVSHQQLVIDPGLGFSKRAAHTFETLANLDLLHRLNRPILVGPSRKSFLQDALGDRPPADREWGTAAAVATAVLLGAHIVRVHGVKQMAEVVRVVDRLTTARVPGGADV